MKLIYHLPCLTYDFNNSKFVEFDYEQALKFLKLVYKDMQFYSHVIHLVSRVSGTLNEGANSIREFIDTFPAGTLSGAPKVRAMQLIEENENEQRAAYGGAIGMFGFDNSFNHAIMIRTFLSKQGTLFYQAGAGIVNASDEKKELQEVNNKLAALRKAMENASGQFH